MHEFYLGRGESKKIETYFYSLSYFYSFRFNRISCTRIRHYVATSLNSYSPEEIRQISYTFMKSKPSTILEHYVLNYRQREAMRLSMELFGKHDFIKPSRKVSGELLKKWYEQTKKRVKGFEDKQLLHLIDVIPGKLIYSFHHFRFSLSPIVVSKA